MLLVFGTSLNVVKVIFLPSPGSWKSPLVLETTQSNCHSFPFVIYLIHLRPRMKSSFSTCRSIMGEKETVLFNCTAFFNRIEEIARTATNRGRNDVGICCGTRPGNWSRLYMVLQTHLVCTGKRATACVWHESYFAGEEGPLEGLPLRSPSQCLEIPFSPVLHICLFLVSFSCSYCTSHLFGMLLTFLIVLYSFSQTKWVKEISSMSLVIR